MITIIIGRTGSGKTSLGSAIAIRAMDNGEEAVEMCKESTKKYSDYMNIEIPKEHLVYCDFFISGSEVFNVPRSPYFTTGFRIGLPNDDFETDYFPFGSTIVLDETRKYWSARKSTQGYEAGGTHEKVLEFFELSRQNGLDIYLIMHMVNQVDIQIRSQAHQVLAPEKIEFFEVVQKLKSVVTRWTGKKYNSIQDYESSLMGVKVESEDFIYEFNGDIRECYDTNFFRFKFFEGLKKYSQNRLVPCDGTKKSVRDLVKKFSSCSVYVNIKKEKKNAVSKSRRTSISYL